MTSRDLLEALTRLAELAFVGRVLLSLLPPGLPGRHGFRELAATWGASHVLGSVALAAEGAAASWLGVEPARWTLVAPWLLVGFVRWSTLPGAIVPRHEPLEERPGTLDRALRLLAPAGILVACFLEGAPAGVEAVAVAANALAILACIAFALARSRRAPTIRALAVVALAAVLGVAIAASRVETLQVALGLGAGAAFAAVWIRRGDRRALLLATISFAGCALLGAREATFGFAGLFALWVHTAEASKRWVGLRAVTALVVAGCLGWPRYTPLVGDPTLPSWLWIAVLFVVALALAKRKRLAGARLRDETVAAGIDSTHAERDAVRDIVILSLVPLAARGELSSFESLVPSLLPLAPVVLLELGLAFAPAESPPGAAPAARGIAGR